MATLIYIYLFIDHKYMSDPSIILLDSLQPQIMYLNTLQVNSL